MIWLFVILFILQAGFHWFFHPAIIASTHFLELGNLGVLIVCFVLWIFSGGQRVNFFNDP